MSMFQKASETTKESAALHSIMLNSGVTSQ